MATGLVKWSKAAGEFFLKAKDKSIVLDLVISYACASQTGEGFEELINTINSESIKRKVKKVIITDTSYLYRHDKPEFAKYADPTIPTQWYLKNKETIAKLKIEKEVKSWAVGLNTQDFRKWHNRIRKDFEGDENGVGSIVLEFRDKVMQAASVAAYKNNVDVKDCIEFMLEEASYVCAFLNGSALVYPSELASPITSATERYKIGINNLEYKLSKQIQQNGECIDIDTIDKEVISFMKNKVSNVNFFVIDRHGNQIYKNYALNKIIGDVTNSKRLSNEAWKNSIKVINDKKQYSFEESYNDMVFLSVKAPLLINGKVEGVIGIAVDITGKKKSEELSNKLKMQEELYTVAKWVAHDIAQPVTVLKGYLELNTSLKETERKIFTEATRSIENIADRLLIKYRGGRDLEETNYILVRWLQHSVNQGVSRYREREIEFKSDFDKLNKFVFIEGNFVDFNRMISNLLNNAVEAIEEDKKGEIYVSYIVKDEKVEIRIKDNGKGMPKKIVERILSEKRVETTKEKGHGLGMEQVKATLKVMKGKMEIKTKEGVGTEFILKFPKVETPKWFADKIELHKGDTVVILDDEVLMHNIWKEKLKLYGDTINVRCFTKGLEALKFLKSMEDKKKAFLLADYKLRNQDIDGINVIDKSGMKERHILVTNVYLSEIKDFDKKSEYIKTFPKVIFNDFSLSVG